MDYERIHNPDSQGGGFSPSKLRAMLLGVEKQRRTEDPEPDTSGEVRSGDECRDVCVVLSPLPAPMPPFSKPAPSKWDDAQKWILNPGVTRPSKPLKKGAPTVHGCGNRQPSAKIVLEVVEEVEAKQVDSYPQLDKREKPASFVETSFSDSAIRLRQHDTATSHQAATTTVIAPPETVRAVSMRDMGTEMTPIVSQEPSRTGTPVRDTTPLRSLTSSRSSSPRRCAPILATAELAHCFGDHSNKELSEKELQRKTRREIMLLGTQLGKANIAAWASREDEGKDALALAMPLDQQARHAVEARAAAWEEGEKTRYMARFKEEEVKIEAWVNHEKAKAEAEMKEIEVKLERMKTCAQDRLNNKLAAKRHKAEEKHAAAEAKRNKQATRTAHQAEYLRQTGHIPSLFSCWRWCR